MNYRRQKLDEARPDAEIVQFIDLFQNHEDPTPSQSTKTTMVQCSYCTMACIVVPDQLCGQCHLLYTHVCDGCAAEACRTSTNTCHRCTSRPHICISRCLGGCIERKPVICLCGTKARRQRVVKKSQNEGRYFYSCYKCNFFEWEY